MVSNFPTCVNQKWIPAYILLSFSFANLSANEQVSWFYQQYSSVKPAKRISKSNDTPNQADAIHLIERNLFYLF